MAAGRSRYGEAETAQDEYMAYRLGLHPALQGVEEVLRKPSQFILG